MRANRAAAAIVAAMLVPVADAAAQPAPEPAIETIEVADGIYMLQGQGGNIGLAVGPDATFLIDDQYAPATAAIQAAVAAVTERPIDFVLNTHWHGDHTGGNENLGEAGAWIVAHDKVRERLRTGGYIATFDMRTGPAAPVALPTLTFAHGMTFHLNGQTLRVEHLDANAHTDGDSVVFFEEADVVHLGDTLFAGMYPFIDVGAGGTLAGMIRHADAVLAKIGPDTKIIPGHGPLSTRADLQASRDMMQSVHDAISALVDEGMSRDEVIAAKPTAPWDEAWTGFLPPDVVVGYLYDSVVAERE